MAFITTDVVIVDPRRQKKRVFFSFIYILFSFSINKNVNEEKLFQLYYEHERRVFFTK
jgi:hypothetical protein